MPKVLSCAIKVKVAVKTATLDEIIKTADFITLHTPFVDKALIGVDELAQMKKGVGLVNISRGGLINELALVDALNSGQVSFAAVDVFDNEPTPREEIIKHPKISLTPHIGAATNEAQERIGVELASLIIGHFNK
jgi:D-3-phosphoglycerate dehydrogenase